MKTTKILFVSLIIFTLSLSNVQNLNIGESIDSANETMKSIVKEMGLEKGVNITKSNIRDAWYRLLNKMYPEEYPLHENTFRGIVEKYVAELPDVIPRMDLGKYFNQEKINNFLQETKHSYGDKFMDYMRGAFEKMKYMYHYVTGTEHEETFTEKVKRVVEENTPEMIKDAIKTDV